MGLEQGTGPQYPRAPGTGGGSSASPGKMCFYGKTKSRSVTRAMAIFQEMFVFLSPF